MSTTLPDGAVCRNGLHSAVSQPRETRNTVIDLEAVSRFETGERVFHQKFGYGSIIGIEGDKLEIAFEKAGTKKVVASYISAADDIPF